MGDLWPVLSEEPTQHRAGKPDPSRSASAGLGVQSPVFPRVVAGRRSGGPHKERRGLPTDDIHVQFIAEQSNPAQLMLEFYPISSRPVCPLHPIFAPRKAVNPRFSGVCATHRGRHVRRRAKPHAGTDGRGICGRESGDIVRPFPRLFYHIGQEISGPIPALS